ncbi:VWA domain-containing protein [Aestuariirhabdus sp. Z084]|uniref:VWA domain-containing protein n=1 Tax=Aestuariirhabdus haliotis TaxID=2918751 RepID=UPI00201B3BAB|nr:VWA domain-containing protein [Aestuariirhabdus haliotis]MCL6416895.1 VWA domain-containing protein [Aestuariirhabdus haliotis]MCL6420886.1 VWA domain-containing protein [Aestuariirhabdus haliotis]
MLIDISGSMKANDPNNLRVPAVELMADLLPDGSKAGVWTFGQEVNMLVPYGAVNEQWREVARKELKKINSVALHTNIGAALDKASFDRSESPTSGPRHMVILTDGMVDVSKDPEVDKAARDQILSEQLPELVKSDFRLHTIALSDNSDKELMETLAIDSGGFSSQADDAKALTKLFLKALEQASPVDEVPLKGNRFLIDSSIDEFTLLAFKKDSNQPVRLQSPSEAIIDRDNPGEGVRWHATTSYDLITIPQPFEGEWVLQSEESPENRVTVVSDLKMSVSRLPANAYLGERLSLQVRFTDAEQPITKPEFLDLIDATVEVRDSEGEQVARVEQSGRELSEGRFDYVLPAFPDQGSYEVAVLADGRTFKREMRQQVSVRKPFQFSAELITGTGPDRFEVEVIPRSQTIDRGATQVFARIRKPDGTKQLRGVDLSEDGRKWRFPIEALTRGEYQVSLKVSVVTRDNKAFEVRADPLVLNYPEGGKVQADVSINEPAQSEQVVPPQHNEQLLSQSVEASDQVAPDADKEPLTEQEAKVEPDEPAVTESPEAAEKEPAKEAVEAPEAENPAEAKAEGEAPEEESKLWLYLGLALGNLLLLGGLIFVYMKFIREPKPAAPVEEVEEDGDDAR